MFFEVLKFDESKWIYIKNIKNSLFLFFGHFKAIYSIQTHGVLNQIKIKSKDEIEF